MATSSDERNLTKMEFTEYLYRESDPSCSEIGQEDTVFSRNQWNFEQEGYSTLWENVEVQSNTDNLKILSNYMSDLEVSNPMDLMKPCDYKNCRNLSLFAKGTIWAFADKFVQAEFNFCENPMHNQSHLINEYTECIDVLWNVLKRNGVHALWYTDLIPMDMNTLRIARFMLKFAGNTLNEICDVWSTHSRPEGLEFDRRNLKINFEICDDIIKDNENYVKMTT